MRPIPVIDLFAGPGGLGEGFSSYVPPPGRRSFKIRLSIEKDREAHSTLTLRAFFRQFRQGAAPKAYYDHLRGTLSREALFAAFPAQARSAQKEAWLCELGQNSAEEVDERVSTALDGAEKWVLIGGPPCQAYSLVGRSRMRGVDPAKFEQDPRHFLYREYLRVIAKHRPPVFVMENVKGLLSASHGGSNIFRRIIEDLETPCQSVHGSGSKGLGYRLHALARPRQDSLPAARCAPRDFVLRSEAYGIPQARHRVIIVGVREDDRRSPGFLSPAHRVVPLIDVVSDLPPLRSQISRGADSPDAWVAILRTTVAALSADAGPLPTFLRSLDFERTGDLGTGAEFVRLRRKPRYRADWYRDDLLAGVCNHVSRTHLAADIQRYFFAAAFAAANGGVRSPVLADFPEFLLPKHENVALARSGSMFSDRFRVQVGSRPSSTITSHIAKDGHYYIHPDPLQARSLTVREAARLQTFPDNYLFCGPRTSQYQQVGNAVPPLLARQIADVLAELLQG